MPDAKLYILPDDREYAVKRIAELEKEIQDMGPDFYEAFNQSSETWHDNAPFDALREKQDLLDAERRALRRMLQSMAPGLPKLKKGMIGIGSRVVLTDASNQTKTYLVAGDWTANAGKEIDGALVVSTQAPLAMALIGKKLNDTVSIPPRNAKMTVAQIDQ